MNLRGMLALASLLLASLLLAGCHAPQQAPSDGGDFSRLVTLAPQLTELVFAAGAGDTLVGVSAYSNYPPAAARLPMVSDAFTVDQEQLALLRPDLLLAWQSGTPAHVVDELRKAGYRVEIIRTRSLSDIAPALLRLGELTGHGASAAVAAAAFTEQIGSLRDAYASRDALSVFFQVSRRPLYTVNGQHYIGEIIKLCGGTNSFEDLSELAPSVSVEAVVERDPEAFFAAGDELDGEFEDWQRWPGIAANRYDNFFVVNPDQISRAGVRLIDGARSICEQLEVARANRAAYAQG